MTTDSEDPPPGTRMARVRTLKILGFYDAAPRRADAADAPEPLSVGGLAIFDAADAATLAARRARLSDPRENGGGS